MTTDPWCPITEIGDVVIHHDAPKVWQPAAIVRNGDVVGHRTQAHMSRAAAMTAARRLLLPGRRIYIRHSDDAIWEDAGA
jgi:hypothetical protein